MARWIWIAVVLAACGGKQREANKQAFAAIKAKLQTYEECLAGKQKGDFTTQVTLTLEDAGSLGSACATDRSNLAAAIDKLAKPLGEKSPPPAHERATLAVTDKVCSDLASLVASANALAVRMNEPAIVAQSCQPTIAEMVEPPKHMQPVATKMWRSNGALIAYDDTAPGHIARYADGKWDQREAPERMHEFSWPASGPVAVTWSEDQDKRGPRSIVVANGTSEWTEKSKIAIDGVSWIHATSGGRVTIDGFPASTAVTIWRSATSGATFQPPVTLFAPNMTSQESDRDDGTIIAIATEDKGKTTRFEARRLETSSSKPTVTASLSWPEAAAPGNFPKLCAGKTAYWAVVGKHVLASSDIGATWHELGAIGAPLEFGHLACDDTTVVLWDRTDKTHRTLRMCTAKGCAAELPVIATEESMIGFELDDKPELWMGEHSFDDQPYVITARPIEAGGLGAGRVMIAKPIQWGAAAVRDGSSYVLMQPALTTLY